MCGVVRGIRTLSSKPTEAPRAAPPVEFEGCDKCPGLDARCNRLLQEQEEMKYILLTTRQEQNRQFLESKDVRTPALPHPTVVARDIDGTSSVQSSLPETPTPRPCRSTRQVGQTANGKHGVPQRRNSVPNPPTLLVERDVFLPFVVFADPTKAGAGERPRAPLPTRCDGTLPGEGGGGGAKDHFDIDGHSIVSTWSCHRRWKQRRHRWVCA